MKFAHILRDLSELERSIDKNYAIQKEKVVRIKEEVERASLGVVSSR